MIVALIGNPNSGKTTLFNALTGSSQRVGNWPGVTVERKEADFTIGTLRATLVDLPGIYALAPTSLEEKIARDFISEGAPDVILNIVDATNLARNLYLTRQLIERRCPLVVAVNLMDELKARGGAVDCARLARALGLPVVPISAKRREGFDALLAALHAQITRPVRPMPSGDGVARSTRPAQPNPAAGGARSTSPAQPTPSSSGARSTSPTQPNPSSSGARSTSPAQPIPLAGGALNADDTADLPRAASLRYAAIDRALAASGYRAPSNRATRAIDGVLLHRGLAVPLFLVVMALIFLLTFGPVGMALAGLADGLIDLMRGGLARVLSGAPPWFGALITDGVVAGVGGVATFLPQILLLFLCLTVLEDSGYMARAAFIADRPLRALGLSGRSFIPLLMGYGCTTTAVLGARAVENERERRMTILLTPFMSCGAKLPIYALIAAAIYPRSAYLTLCALYLLDALAMAACGTILRRTVFAGGAAFVMEMPPYRLPAFLNVVKRMRRRAWDFLQRAGTLIFAMSVITWFLQSFTPGLRFAVSPDASLFALLGGAIAPFLAPLGFGDWRRAVALLSGLIAKEGVVSTLQVLYASMGSARSLADALRADFTNLSAASFLVFTLLYTPCLPALATIARETGSRRDTCIAALLPLLFAYAAAFLVYQIGGALGL